MQEPFIRSWLHFFCNGVITIITIFVVIDFYAIAILISAWKLFSIVKSFSLLKPNVSPYHIIIISSSIIIISLYLFNIIKKILAAPKVF